MKGIKQLVPTSIKDEYYIRPRRKGLKKAIRLARERTGKWTAEAAVDFLFSKDCSYVTPWQHKEELLLLAKEIEQKQPQTVLEIGTAYGGTLFLSALLCPDDALLVSLDLPEGLYGGGYREWKIPFYKSFARANQKIELLRGDSHSEASFNTVREMLGDRKIDYLFIDADHTYEGVKSDFETYVQLVDENGMVAFHDIVSDKDPQPDHFVAEYWEEIKGNYQHKEFVKDWNQSKLGLGLIYLNAEAQ